MADTRVWAYSPAGEARIFDSPADVPKGWADSPAAFDKPVKTPRPAFARVVA